MGILYALLFTKALHSQKVNIKKVIKTVKRDSSFFLELIIEILQLIYGLVSFIFKVINSTLKKFYQNKIVKNSTNNSSSSNIVDITEYKLKKAK